MAGGGIAIYDPSTAPGGRVTFKGILDHIDKRLHAARVFRQRLVRVPFDLDHPYWIEDPDFDLEFHVRHIALPKPGDWRQLCIQVARLVSRPLDLDRPLWEFYVVEGLDNVEGIPRGSFAVVTQGAPRRHRRHVRDGDDERHPRRLPDGHPVGSGRRLAAGIGAEHGEPAAAGGHEQRHAPDARQQSGGAIGPAAGPAATTADRARHRAAADDDPAHPLERSGQRPPCVRRRAPAPRRPAAIKATVPGATINDVVLTIVGGALRIVPARQG